MTMRSNILTAFATATTLSLAACGGGGGGGSTSDTSQAPVTSSPAGTSTAPANTLSAITVSNYTAAGANAFTSAEALNNAASASSSFVTGVTIENASPNVAKAVIDLVAYSSANRPAATVAGVTQTEACPNGGSITLSGNIQDTNTFTSGDNVTFTSTGCLINGIVLNGVFNISVNSISSNVSSNSPWNANMSVQYNQFSVSAGSEKITVSGDMTLNFGQTDSSHRNFALTGNSLQAVATRNGVSIADRTLQGYTGTLTTANLISTSSIGYTLTGKSTALGQFNVAVKTLKPFILTSGSYPTSGSLIVNGASSSVSLTALDGTNVRLDYSAKGDGVITQTSTTTWVKLNSSI